MSTARSTRRSYDQACPVAHALDLVGERWTLLIVRDLLFGPLRFTDLRDGLAGLAPNLLSDRLRRLTERGLVEQAELPPPAARTVYVLTPRGRELGPVIHELARFGVAEWGDPDEDPPPERLVRGALLALMAPERLGPAAWTALIRLPETDVGLRVAAADPDLSPLARLRLAIHAPLAAGTPELEVRTTLGTLLEVRRGHITAEVAEREGRLFLLGADDVAEELGRLLGWHPAPRRTSAHDPGIRAGRP